MMMFFVAAASLQQQQQDQFLYDERVHVTNARCMNENVIWARPKGLEYGNLPGSSPPQKANLFPDKYATYFVANLQMQQLGWRLVVRGRYPRARYFSLTVAEQLGNGQIGNGDFLNNLDIAPDEGSVNPYWGDGSDSSWNAPNRNYTVYVVYGERPPFRAKNNTIYTGLYWQSNRTHLALRVYLPDAGYDGTGAEELTSGNMEECRGLPVVSLDMRNGTVVSGPSILDILDAQKNGDPDGYDLTQWLSEVAASPNPTSNPCPRVGASQKFWNTPYSISGLFLVSHPEERVLTYPPSNSGGFGSDPDTCYVQLCASFEYGDVYMVRGKKPSHPQTYNRGKHRELMNTTTMDVQYFSVSTGASPPSGEGWDTTYDEEIPTDDRGFYTIVVSWPWNRPASAVRENGVVWLSPGDGEGHYVGARNWVVTVNIRFQSMNPEWIHSPANIPMPTPQEPVQQDALVMGLYYPTGEYYASASDFDAAVAATAATSSDEQPPLSLITVTLPAAA